MSGNYKTANTANNTADQIFTEGTSEFGMPVFSDPHIQETYKRLEDEYKKKFNLKQAYDKQEFLRRMRIDIKREYLTRKKQLKTLQKHAAVERRNAEMSLQEHYASSNQGEAPYRIRGIDISAPLVSQIALGYGEVLDLKAFHAKSEFSKVVDFHKSLSQQIESELRWSQGIVEFSEWFNQSPPTSADGEEEDGPATIKRGAFGGCYDEPEPEEPETDTNALNSNNKWNLPMTAEEREILEKGEAAQNQRTEDPSCYYTFVNTHDAIDHAAWVFGSIQERQATAGMTEEDREAHYREIQRRAYSDDEEEEEQRWIEDTRDLWENEENNNEAEAEYPDAQQLEVVKVTEPKERITASAAAGGMLSAQKKAVAGAAAKARIAKQQLRKKTKFVPLKVTENSNRTNEVTATLSANKLEINLPKKHLQNATREAMKQHNQKWNRINAAQKHIGARGTKVANMPEPKFYGGGSDSDGDY